MARSRQPSAQQFQVVAPRVRRHDRPRFDVRAPVLLAPSMLLLLCLFIAPIIFSFYLGLTNIQLIGINSINYRFTGLANVRRLFQDAEFSHSLLLTVYFVLGSGAIATSAAGLFLAIMLQRSAPLVRMTVGALAMLACILPPATVAIVWFSVSTAGGAFPVMFNASETDFLYNYPMLTVCFANMWSLCGLSFLMFSASLKNIPQDMYEAAKLEQASDLQCFWRITLPMLRPTIVTSSLLMTLLSFGNFTLVFFMTGGGPALKTNILPIYSYVQAFKFQNLGYGALLGAVIVILTAVLGLAFIAIDRLASGSAVTLTKKNNSIRG